MVSTPKHKEIFNQGRELLAQKDHEGALELFNTLLSREVGFALPASDRLMALDHRAATFIKLGDHPSALQDGRCMIKVKKGDSQGYLRTGTVCEHLEQYETALGVYKYGLQNVLPTEPSFKLLRMRYELMIKKCKTRDPVRVLPSDLVEMVMKHLSFANVTQLLRVSMLWCTTLTALPSLWTHLDLTGAFRSVSINTIRHYIVRSRNGPARASLYLSKTRDDVMWNDLLLQCPTLKHLDIKFTGDYEYIEDCTLLKSVPFFAGLQVLVVSAHFTLPFNSVIKLLGSCKKLARAEFHRVEGSIVDAEWTSNVSAIRSLTINALASMPLRVSLDTLTKLLERIPEVEHLRLHSWLFDWAAMNFTMLKNLQNIDLTQSSLGLFPRLPESLQALNLTSCVFSASAYASAYSLTDHINENQLPNLKALVLAHMHDLVVDGLRSLLSANKGNLMALNLAHCNKLAREDISSLIQDGYLRAITILNLAACDFTDEIAQLLAMASSGLENLDIEHTKVTGVGVKALVLKSGRKLEKLKLNSCLLVSKDAIDFARDNGINVQFIIYEEPRPGVTRKRQKRFLRH